MKKPVIDRNRPLGLYLHIPFCKAKCAYCDFYSLPHSQEKMDAYAAALARHITEVAPQMQNHRVDTVYFGGGTPSYLGHKRLIALLKTVKKQCRVWDRAEITLEANPDSAGDWRALRALRRAGFNRISLGVQSSDDETLRRLGRVHTWQQVKDAVAACRKAGLDNISLDLIYGLPDQTMEQWENTLADALVLAPRHISCYGLKLEEGTPLYDRRESLNLPDGDLQADMYLYAVELLTQNGYQQYEISNFAQPGYESRHNLKYWQLDDYMGFGPGAHSCIGRTRYSYVRDLDRYLAGVLHGEDMIDEYETIGDFERAAEYLMLGMRTVHGVSRAEYERLYRSDFSGIAQQLEEFVRRGWAVADGERWHFTPSGFLLSNVLIGKLLEAQTDRKAEHNPWMKPQIEKQPRTKLPPGEAEAFRDTYLNNPILTRTDRSQNHET